MNGLKSVIITLPKGLSKASTATGTISASELIRTVPIPKFNFTASILSDPEGKMLDDDGSIVSQQFQNDNALSKTDIICLRGKKRRLDHLTWEEKLQRKKLKNRVAAQTSRDRKKAKLDKLEDTVNSLKSTNELLTQECTALRSQNESLILETKRLRIERDELKKKEELCSMCQGRIVGCSVPSTGSAESPLNPLPQGGTVQPASSLTLPPASTILLRILTLFLLSKNCLETFKIMITSTDSKNLRKVFCEKLPPEWKQLLANQLLIHDRCHSERIPTRNGMIPNQWWGKHQKMWKPMEV